MLVIIAIIIFISIFISSIAVFLNCLIVIPKISNACRTILEDVETLKRNDYSQTEYLMRENAFLKEEIVQIRELLSDGKSMKAKKGSD